MPRNLHCPRCQLEDLHPAHRLFAPTQHHARHAPHAHLDPPLDLAPAPAHTLTLDLLLGTGAALTLVLLHHLHVVEAIHPLGPDPHLVTAAAMGRTVDPGRHLIVHGPSRVHLLGAPEPVPGLVLPVVAHTGLDAPFLGLSHRHDVEVATRDRFPVRSRLLETRHLKESNLPLHLHPLAEYGISLLAWRRTPPPRRKDDSRRRQSYSQTPPRRH